VEIDPVMIDVAKKYFHIDKISKLQIVNANAQKYVKSQAIKFDYVLVDLYFGEKPPEFIYSKSFITDLKKISKTVVINHLFYDTWSKDNAQKLVEKLHLYFNNIELVRSLANLLIICK
jgi:spermidine synthase